jgi:hypothetical protein
MIQQRSITLLLLLLLGSVVSFVRGESLRSRRLDLPGKYEDGTIDNNEQEATRQGPGITGGPPSGYGEATRDQDRGESCVDDRSGTGVRCEKFGPEDIVEEQPASSNRPVGTGEIDAFGRPIRNSGPATGEVSRPAAAESTRGLDTDVGAFFCFIFPGVAAKDPDNGNRRLEDSDVEVLGNALEVMFFDMIAKEPNLAQMGQESRFNKDSIRVQETEADCSPYKQQFGDNEDMVCTNVDLQFSVTTTAGSDDEAAKIGVGYADMINRGLDNGEFQKSLDKVAPNLGRYVVPASNKAAAPEQHDQQVTIGNGREAPITDPTRNSNMFPVNEEDNGPSGTGEVDGSNRPTLNSDGPATGEANRPVVAETTRGLDAEVGAFFCSIFPGVAAKDPDNGNRRLEESDVEILSDALEVMFMEMFTKEPSLGQMEQESRFNKDSVRVQETEADCSPYRQQFGDNEDMVCTDVELQFSVTTTAESEDEVARIGVGYADMLNRGLSNGEFQNSLDKVAPYLGCFVVPVSGKSAALITDPTRSSNPFTVSQENDDQNQGSDILGRFENNPFQNPIIMEAQGETIDADEVGDPVVHLTIQLDLPTDPYVIDRRSRITAGNLEQWVCYFDALIARRLAFTDSRDHVVVLMIPYEDGFDIRTNTINLELVSSNDPEQLLSDLQSSMDADSIHQWLQAELPRDHPLFDATVVDWEQSLEQATISSDPVESFSSADCGVARVSLSFGFFDDYEYDDDASANQDIGNLMCSTGEYLELLYTALEHGSDIQVTLDRVQWEFDASQEKPLSVSFDLQAVEPETGRRVAPVALLGWLTEADMGDYIQEAAWTALPYEENRFINTESVFLDGNVRYMNAPPPPQSMSTLDCVGGDYPSEEEEAQTQKGDSIQSYATWTFHFGFEEGIVAAEPTHEDMHGLFCATYFYFKDMFRPEQAGPFQPVVYTNFSMDAYEFSFTPSLDMPVTLYIDAQAYLPSGTRVDSAVLRGKMEQKFNADFYLANYVLKAEPVEDNIIHDANMVKVDTGVRERHEFLRMDLNSSICFRETESPTEMPTSAPTLLTHEPTVSPTINEEAEGEDDGPNRGVGIGGMGIPGVGPISDPNKGDSEEVVQELEGSGHRGSTIEVDTSFVAIVEFPGVAPKDQDSADNGYRRLEASVVLGDALAAMFKEILASDPNLLKLDEESKFNKHSVQIEESEIDCSPYYQQFGNKQGMVCNTVYLRFDVMTTSQNDEELAEFEAGYDAMVKTGVENGQLQKSLDEFAPDLGWTVMPPLDAGEGDQTLSEEPPTDEAATEDTKVEKLPALTEPLVTKKPMSTGAPYAEPIEDRPKENSFSFPLWAIIVSMLFLFAIGMVSGMNIMYCLKRRNEGRYL